MTATISHPLIRRSAERGCSDYGWLDSRHSFSFGEYADPKWDGFSDLRALNESRIGPGQGFDMHAHRDMEMLTWVLEGNVQHRDSLGNDRPLHRGEIQLMTAGSGIRHGLSNASGSEDVRYLHFWILPQSRDVATSYEQKAVPPELLRNQLGLVAAPKEEGGIVTIDQDARIFIGRLDKGTSLPYTISEGRAAWIQLARGRLQVSDVGLLAGDGVGLRAAQSLELEALDPCEVLVFDLRG